MESKLEKYRAPVGVSQMTSSDIGKGCVVRMTCLLRRDKSTNIYTLLWYTNKRVAPRCSFISDRDGNSLCNHGINLLLDSITSCNRDGTWSMNGKWFCIKFDMYGHGITFHSFQLFAIFEILKGHQHITKFCNEEFTCCFRKLLMEAYM